MELPTPAADDVPDRAPAAGHIRSPACDGCKDRKTKCDRGAPCSSCRTAGIPCRFTRAGREKRQRIIISAKYDEALESVDTRLQEVLEAVREIHVSGPARDGNHGNPPVLQRSSDFPDNFSDVNPSPSAPRQYLGESSFEAQVRRAAQLTTSDASLGPAAGGLGSEQYILDWTIAQQSYSWNSGILVPSPSPSPAPLLEEYPGLAKHSLPPSDSVLRLLRLTQTEKQRFFVDVDLFNEQHFTELCRNVFFAINPYSIWTWTIVNTGLFYLFAGLNPHRYSELGLDAQQVDQITQSLARNAQAAVNSFRICEDPCLEACQAMALAGTYSIKSGQLGKAWSLLSAAGRMCVDLGFHRPTPGAAGLDQFQSRKVFWYVFVMEKGIALTLGRPAGLRLGDITIDPLDYPNEVLGVPGKLAIAFFELASIEEEMLAYLFSGSPQQATVETRREQALGFRDRVRDVHGRMRTEDCFSGLPYQEAAVLVDILLHSVATVACSAASSGPSPSPSPSPPAANTPSHSCATCVEDARQALQKLCAMQSAKEAPSNPFASTGWAMFLNIVLALAPFTPYLVVATHAASQVSSVDLRLLSSVNKALAPVAEHSSLARDTLQLCLKLHQRVQAVVEVEVSTGSLPGQPGQVGNGVGSDTLLVPNGEHCLSVASSTTAAESPFPDWQAENNN